jgi:hypothetical protein
MPEKSRLSQTIFADLFSVHYESLAESKMRAICEYGRQAGRLSYNLLDCNKFFAERQGLGFCLHLRGVLQLKERCSS